MVLKWFRSRKSPPGPAMGQKDFSVRRNLGKEEQPSSSFREDSCLSKSANQVKQFSDLLPFSCVSHFRHESFPKACLVRNIVDETNDLRVTPPARGTR